MYDNDTWPDPCCLNNCWTVQPTAMNELYDAYLEVVDAEDDPEAIEKFRDAAMEYPEVMALTISSSLPIMKQLLVQGLSVIGGPAVDFLLQRCADAEDNRQEELLVQFSKTAITASTILTTALLDHTNQKGILVLREAAAVSLGKIGFGSKKVVQALTEVAEGVDEPQYLRTFCIEALMDLGPNAADAIPILQRILKQDEDEDLQKHAWAALKSVTAESQYNPCGGTVADYMRSWYRSVTEPDDDD